MRIDSSGNVGIGTSTIAGGRVHISGQTSDTDGLGLDQGQLLITDSDNNTTSGLMLGYRWQSGVAEYARIQARNAAGSTNLALQPGGGNVGIGTANPLSRLVVSNGSNEGIEFTGGSTTVNGGVLQYINRGTSTTRPDMNYYLASGGGAHKFYTDDTERMRITSAGNMGIGTTTPGYRLEVNGSFAATTKSFVINHPTKPGMKLRYGSLEGPENGVYVRGRLSNSNKIVLPDYWTGLVDEDSITVNLTPIGKHQKLYVSNVTIDTITVKNDNILNSAIDCYYIVYAERKDVEKLIVEI
jgi:hypothetical protein